MQLTNKDIYRGLLDVLPNYPENVHYSTPVKAVYRRGGFVLRCVPSQVKIRAMAARYSKAQAFKTNVRKYLAPTLRSLPKKRAGNLDSLAGDHVD